MTDRGPAALLRPDARRPAIAALVDQMYPELLRLARRVRGRGSAASIDTAGLVHEMYLKLAVAERLSFDDRAHLFSIAARAMRQILVDAARRRHAQKRGGPLVAVSFDEQAHPHVLRPEEFLALDEALGRLAEVDARRAAVVEHRFFGGMSTEETATVLGVSTATVERDWRAARAWLAVELGSPG